jgi:ATP-dependent Clp protease protease subunit
MFEGIAIYNVLREHPQDITVKVMGMAASAASIIAMAGDTVEIGAASFIMIHNCWVMAIGNRHDMAETAAVAGAVRRAMRDVYAARTGQKAEEVAKWMDAETFMSGSTAIERGFADASCRRPDEDRTTRPRPKTARSTSCARWSWRSSHGGYTRTQARERINKIKGAATPGAGDDPRAPHAGRWGS